MKIPYIASFGSFIDETSNLADLILPDHSFLESWVDHVPESGTTKTVASVAAPAMKPIHETRPMPDVLLEVGRKLNPPLAPAFQWQTFDQMLQASFGDNWAKAQEQGERAVRLMSAAEALRQASDSQRTPQERIEYDR